MILTFALVLAATVLFNWYVILFGKKDLEVLKSKLSIRTYLKEIEDGLDKIFGDNFTTILKIVFIVLSVVVVIANAFLFLAGLGAFLIGVWLAKKSYQFGPVMSVLRRIAIYINRVRV